MTDTTRTRIGWLGASLPTSSHLQKLERIVPSSVELVHEQLVLHDGVLNDVKGKLDTIVTRAVELTQKHRWDGLIFPGAPREVLNPDLFSGFSSALRIPVATALRASAAALKTFSARRILLLTPFDESLNKLICSFLADFGIAALSPTETLRHYTDALKMTSDNVVAYAKRALANHKSVDAIYFQGAILDPMDCLEKMESDLEIPIVASNPAMLWFIQSKLGLKNPVFGFGKLLESWPSLPVG
jgi:arylmalonate decarboxylase-like protein